MPDMSMFASSNGTQKHPAGHQFFSAGDSGDVMYVVLDGEVDIVIKDATVETVGPGGIFGEMALIDGHERSATARARTTAEVASIDAKRFVQLIRVHPYFAIEVMTVLADRIRQTNRALLAK